MAENDPGGEFPRLVGSEREQLDRSTRVAKGKQVVVYRAEQGATTRPASDALIGMTYDPAGLVAELQSVGHEPTKPNSGLSLQTPAP